MNGRWVRYSLRLLFGLAAFFAVFRLARALGFDDSGWFTLALFIVLVLVIGHAAIRQRRNAQATRLLPLTRFRDVLVYAASAAVGFAVLDYAWDTPPFLHAIHTGLLFGGLVGLIPLWELVRQRRRRVATPVRDPDA